MNCINDWPIFEMYCTNDWSESKLYCINDWSEFKMKKEAYGLSFELVLSPRCSTDM